MLRAAVKKLYEVVVVVYHANIVDEDEMLE